MAPRYLSGQSPKGFCCLPDTLVDALRALVLVTRACGITVDLTRELWRLGIPNVSVLCEARFGQPLTRSRLNERMLRAKTLQAKPVLCL
jgi:hypothetical protein